MHPWVFASLVLTTPTSETALPVKSGPAVGLRRDLLAQEEEPGSELGLDEEGPEPESPENLDESEGPIDDPGLSTEAAVETPGGYNHHGVGVRTGLTMVPTWILGGFTASHTNALCRGDEINDFADERGLTQQNGCNYYVGGEYVYRRSRIFDVVASAGYQHASLPEGYWLDNDEWGDDCSVHNGESCDLGGADYTEINLGFVFIEADFIARAPVVRTPDVELQIGGGGGIGIGIITGDVHQTPIGRGSDGTIGQPGMCTTLEDLKDFTRCTPQWWQDPDASEPIDPVPPEQQFATCTQNSCSKEDLNRFNRVKQDDIPPVVPVINLIASVRLIVKDTLGINLNGGWNTGFYFGGSLQYFFGG